MNHQLTVQLTEGHVKYAAQKFCLRVTSKAVLALAVLTVVILALKVLGQSIDWLVYMLAGIVVFCAMLFFFLYAMLLKRRLALFRQYGGKTDYEFSEELFKSKSGWASLETNWEVFQSLYIFPRIWMLVSRNTGYFTFPADQTTNEIKEFLKRKIVLVGGKIK